MNESGVSARIEAIRDEANSWVAQFAPLVMKNDEIEPEKLQSQIDLIERLRDSGPNVLESLNKELGIQEYNLVQTMRDALAQLDSLEDDVRKRLARVEPGNPEGIADLEALQERLSERQARQEVGVRTDTAIPEVLELEVGPGDLVAAGGSFVFGLGWTAFTVFHNIAMMAGMWMAFGPIALLLMFFYAIFYAVGIGMLMSAFNLAAKESIVLDGDQLTIVRSYGKIRREKKYQIITEAKARVEMSPKNLQPRSKGQSPSPAITLSKSNGSPIYFGATSSSSRQEEIVNQINRYLKAHRVR